MKAKENQSRRRQVIAANWKMYKRPGDPQVFVNSLIAGLSGAKKKSVELVIFAQSALLPELVRAISEKSEELDKFEVSLACGPQNIHWEKEGAYTGEMSVDLTSALGATFCLVGHSERRQLFGEQDSSAAKRAITGIQAGIRVVFCIGESLREREAGDTFRVLDRQLEPLLGLLPEAPKNLLIAYEPVWAIGTGKSASVSEASEVHHYLRKRLREAWGELAAESIPLLYGGSVKPENAGAILAAPHIDGVLVGGASLDPKQLLAIAAAAKE